MPAQVIRATLEQGELRRSTDRAAKRRQIAMKKLILQRPRAGRDDHALARQQRRHEIGKCLARARAGLDDQRRALLHRRRQQRAPSAAGRHVWRNRESCAPARQWPRRCHRDRQCVINSASPESAAAPSRLRLAATASASGHACSPRRGPGGRRWPVAWTCRSAGGAKGLPAIDRKLDLGRRPDSGAAYVVHAEG